MCFNSILVPVNKLTDIQKNNLRISFVTSGHYPYDDRIFYHQGITLADYGFQVQIISAKTNLISSDSGIELNSFDGSLISKREKIKKSIEILRQFYPDVIICSEPLPVVAARLFKRRAGKHVRIIYDITEWYPSKKNFSDKKGIRKYSYFIRLLLFNLLSSSLTDAFIFGEYYKSRPYRILFPFKPFIYSTYYPGLNYIDYRQPGLVPGKLNLSYSGKISREKGFINFIGVINRLSAIYKDLKIYVKITGWLESDEDKKECEVLLKNENANINLIVEGKQSFNSYVKNLYDTDIFLDLREDDHENQYCLPIRLFYYAASGRPVIFSDLKAIRKEVEIEKFGFLVKPGETEMIVRLISKYLENDDLYYSHCHEARILAETKYNWGKIRSEFVKFVGLTNK